MKTIDSKVVAEGRVIKVRVDVIETPDGQRVKRDIVEHRGAVAMVPIDAEGRVILVRQYRHAAGKWLLEIPAGTLDPGEDPLEAAQRELREETGFAAGRIDLIGGCYAAPGYSSEYLYLYLARDLTEDPLEGDVDEEIELEPVPLTEVRKLIASGEIEDAKSLAALLLVLADEDF